MNIDDIYMMFMIKCMQRLCQDYVTYVTYIDYCFLFFPTVFIALCPGLAWAEARPLRRAVQRLFEETCWNRCRDEFETSSDFSDLE